MSNFDIPKPLEIPEGYQFDPKTNQYIWVGIAEKSVQKLVVAQPEKKTTSMLEKLKRFWWAPTIGVILILGIIAALVFNMSSTTKSQDNIEVKWSQTSPNLPLGNTNTWVLEINNYENIDMQNLVVNLSMPESYEFVSEGTTLPEPDISGRNFVVSRVRANENRKFFVKGKINAQIDDELTTTGMIYYAFRGNKYLELPKIITKITSPEIKLELNSNNPTAENNAEIEWVAKIRNTRESDINNIKIRFAYPNGNLFQYKSSSLVANNNYTDQKINPDNNTASDSVWFIDRLPGLSEYILRVKGVISGTTGNKANFGVEASIKSNSEYNPVSYATKDIEIISQPLIITTKIDGKDKDKTFKAGETLNVSVYYQNNSRNTLRNLQIRGYIEDLSSILDFSTLKFVGGERGNVNNGKIEWQGTGVPQLVNLTPQAKGVLQYSVKVRDKEKFYNSERSQEKYILIPKVEAFGTNQEAISYTDNLYKARSNIYFDQKITEISEKKFRVTWSISNEQNQINNITLSTTSPLPPNFWEKTLPAKLGYNPENGQLSWKVEKLESYSGMFGKPASISFELDIENQDLLFNETTLNATDDVTGEVFVIQAESGKI
jgi:hypothetical protein